MRIGRCRKGSLASLLLFLLAAGWWIPGWCADLEQEAKEIADQARSRIEDYRDIAEAIARCQRRQIERQLQPQLRPQTSVEQPEKVLIFITLGETPDEDIQKNRQLLQDIRAASPDAVVVLRGLPAGHRTLDSLALYARKLTADSGLSGFVLDPTLFRKYQVGVAPTMVLEREGRRVAEVRGVVNAAWLRRQIETGQKGDIGQWGPTSPIAERDLIEELQERLLAVDWGKAKRQAYANYWQRYHFTELPEAKEDRRFTLDAKYTVERDYVLPNGTVIARKGEVKDLFKIVKPTFVLLIFDAARPEHVAWAREQAREYHGKLRVKYLATTIPDRENGWKSLEKLEEQLQGPVYLLNEQIRDRFQVRYVPALVRPEKECFEVREMCLKK